MRRPIAAAAFTVALFCASVNARGGAVLVKEAGDPGGLTVVGSLLYFNEGLSIWQSDGTPGGTFTFPELVPFLNAYGYLRGVTYFGAEEKNCTNCDFELYRSDGTLSGTYPVMGPTANWVDRPYPEEFEVMNGMLYIAGGGLWRSDGTEEGTARVYGGAFIDSPNYLSVVGGQLFFYNSDGIHGRELWRSDGTEEGTYMVRDIRKGAGGSVLYMPFTVVGKEVYFAADDGIHGRELWRSNGTRGGTYMINDICPGPCDGIQHTPFWAGLMHYVESRGVTYFTADEGIHGLELWRTDGTAAGTRMVKDILPGPEGLGARGLASMNGVLYFYIDDGVHGSELWRSSGTKEGTFMVKDIRPGSRSSSQFKDYAVAGDVVYFAAQDGFHGYEVYRTDGTKDGTYLAADIWPGSRGSWPEEFTAQCGKLYFNAQGPTAHRNLYRFDRYPDGFVDVKAGGADGFSVHEKQVDGDLVITAAVRPLQAEGTASDWWLRATAPGGAQLWYTRAGDWIRSAVPVRAHAGPLRDVGPRIVLSTEKIPQGRWKFDLAVDRMDGIPQWNACDTVGVEVKR